jgi:hypothetical protein
LHPAAAPPGPALALPNPDVTPKFVSRTGDVSGDLVALDPFTHGNILTALRTANAKPDGSPGLADSFTLKTANKVADAIQNDDLVAAKAYIARARIDLENGSLASSTNVARTDILDAAKATLDKYEAKVAGPAPVEARPDLPGGQPEAVNEPSAQAFQESAEAANAPAPPEGAQPGGSRHRSRSTCR